MLILAISIFFIYFTSKPFWCTRLLRTPIRQSRIYMLLKGIKVWKQEYVHLISGHGKPICKENFSHSRKPTNYLVIALNIQNWVTSLKIS